MQVQHFFDPNTWTLTYVVWDEATKDAVIIDPVLDFDPVNLQFSSGSLDAVLAFAQEHGLNIHFGLETHVHADHVSAAAELRRRTGAKLVVADAVRGVQETFGVILALDTPRDGSQFDVLVKDGDELQAGSLGIRVISTPGHTPADLTYQIGDALFTGDTLFMPDFGTGRCDFPKGSASDLYDSIQKLYALPGETRVFVGHDYQPGGRELQFETTVHASRTENKQLRHDTSRDEFVTWRTQRDAGLNLPRLLFQAVQLNLSAGDLPPADDKGRRILHIPLL